MMWRVIPQALDAGELGLRIEADAAEAAAALAVAGPYAGHVGEPMVVRWDLLYDRQGELQFARCVEVVVGEAVPAVPTPIVAPPSAPPVEVEPLVVMVAEIPIA